MDNAVNDIIKEIITTNSTKEGPDFRVSEFIFVGYLYRGTAEINPLLSAVEFDLQLVFNTDPVLA